MVKNLPVNAGDAKDTSSIPGSRIFPGEDNCSPLQYSCLENSMERGTWHAIVHGVAKSCKRPRNWAHTHSIENHNSCTKIQSLQQDTNLPSPAFVSSRLFDDSHSNRCEMISHCCFNLHSLLTLDVEHLFMYLLVFHISSWQKCLSRSFSHFSIGLFGIFLLLSCLSSFYSLNINPLSNTWFANIFPFSRFCFFFSPLYSCAEDF